MFSCGFSSGDRGGRSIRVRLFLDLALVIAFAGSAKPILEQIMADEFGEGAGALALAVAENPRHRDFEIVVQN